MWYSNSIPAFWDLFLWIDTLIYLLRGEIKIEWFEASPGYQLIFIFVSIMTSVSKLWWLNIRSIVTQNPELNRDTLAVKILNQPNIDPLITNDLLQSYRYVHRMKKHVKALDENMSHE